ncbi:lipopolysaccharide heptosyltransferase I [Luteitalea sp. TBR-22]|uniref:glycosyltransferase family 9 protein n=1 Tax=Luteitalea sp. TBR-22 TaxID=2802971 RepID=UPI001AF64EC8|nr:glycosyltransferase family 9 protein [Luteitalea sp. TBR-22]BCS34756.1 lipopolysaccharide heptosyltransferase I [Luteitalea sp. TBR-22]
MTSFLIVRLGALGDIVHAMPVVTALRAAYPAARIGWLVHPRFVPLVQTVQGLDRIHPLDRRTGTRVIAEVRRERYDVCLDLQGLLKSAAVARLSGAGRVLGFSRRWLREPAASLAYTDVGGDGSGHVVAKNLSLLALLGLAPGPPRFALAIPATPVVPCTREILRLRADDPFAVINPGAAWPNKRWPAERFGALARVLRERHGLRSAVLWGPDEATLAAAVVRASDGAAAMAPQTTMVEMLAVARAARVLISGDTGPLHLAAAAGTPVVGVFGPTPPARNGPWDPRDLVVSAHDACQCAFKRRCTATRWCLETVSVEQVAAAVAARLEAAA